MSIGPSTATLPPIAVEARADSQKPAPERQSHGGFSAVFHELIDIINPLQHIPVISTIYRHITGDEISPVAKVAGGALFGGVVGLGLSIADVAVEQATGEDTGEHVLALFGGGSDENVEEQRPTALAAASVPQVPKGAADAGKDDTKWFPAFPAGSIHPAALSYAQPANENASGAATKTAQAVAANAAVPAPKPPNNATTLALHQAQSAIPAGIPQMDQATFDALLRSFGSSAVAGITPKSDSAEDSAPRNAAGQPTDTLGAARVAASSAVEPRPGPVMSSYDAALQAMQRGLDQYQAGGGRIPPVAGFGAAPST